MRAAAAAAAIALATVTGCARDPDPCDFATCGAPWMALASLEPGSWDVEIIRADGSCRRGISPDPAVDLAPAWGPGGLLAFDSSRAPGQGIWIHDVAAGTIRRLDTGGLLATSPAFSPDGASIAFEGRTAGATTGAIYAVAAGGGTPVLLTPEAEPHGNGGPAYSPDGATLYFVSNRTGAYEVWSVPTSGGAAQQVTTGSRIVGKPVVSPDGARLAYARATATGTEVVLLALDGGGVVAPLLAGASEPAWDPGGTRLAVRVFGDGGSRVALVPLDGSPATYVTAGPGPDGAPAFAPR